jgi:meso-butanediol dehydrogenase / (S,S)-butanediol dehydrogenase / diacetyl reductase
MSLKGKVALVTGAGRGIGKAAAIALAQAGADVAIADIDAASAEGTREAIEAMGRRSLAVQADLGDLGDIDALVERTVRELDAIDILVNNAALTQHGRFLEVSEATWDKLHRVNAKGAFFCSQRVARQMVAQGWGGRIVNIASIAGKGYAQTSNQAYAASKGAVISMTYIAAHQLAEHDITVNAICPGVVLTPLLDGMLAERSEQTGLSVDELKERMCKPIPIGRANVPEDIAAMVVFLEGTGARNITGQTINVDGGLIMH